jgi:hypothetical protein
MQEIPITILYANRNKNIEGVYKTSVHINADKNEIEKEDFVTLVGNHNYFKRKHYFILDVLKYQVLINSPEDIRLYTKKPELFDSFVEKGWRYSNDIAWPNTLPNLKSMNTLILLFKEKDQKKSSANKSKKFIPPITSSSSSSKKTMSSKPMRLH